MYAKRYQCIQADQKLWLKSVYPSNNKNCKIKRKQLNSLSSVIANMNADIRLIVSIGVMIISVYLIYMKEITYGLTLLGMLLGYTFGKKESQMVLRLKSISMKLKGK